jgi:proline iminopeptidase
LGNRVIPSERYLDDHFRLCFTRLVTHYFGHYAFLDDNYITGNLQNIREVPLIMVRGRLDVSSQLSIAWNIHRQLPLSDLYLIDDSGHGGSEYMHRVLVGATAYFAGQ